LLREVLGEPGDDDLAPGGLGFQGGVDAFARELPLEQARVRPWPGVS
jgi:hypothetical protein